MSLVQQSAQFAIGILQNYPASFAFHNRSHTVGVAEAAAAIASAEGLSPAECELVEVAAWFHDLGYLQNSASHEESSCEIARAKLQAWHVPEVAIEVILRTIMATKMPQNPTHILDKVICDADMSHLTRENFLEISNQLRVELANIKNIQFPNNVVWWKFNLEFMQKHRYWTRYANINFNQTKANNISLLENLIKSNSSLREQPI